MPNFDASGPRGAGPLTGRRQGRCLDNGNRNYGHGLGLSGGYGRGGCYGHRGAGRGFGVGHGGGFGYDPHFRSMADETYASQHLAGASGKSAPVLSQQLSRAIDQLSALLEQWKTRGTQDETA